MLSPHTNTSVKCGVACKIPDRLAAKATTNLKFISTAVIGDFNGWAHI